jgi:hypothetical protein
MHRFRPKIAPPLVISLLALFIAAGGGDALAEIIISDNSQVAKGTISGHNPPAGKRSNIIRGSVNGRDLSDRFKASVTLPCPGDLVRSGDVCFEFEQRELAPLETALARCASDGLRLPTDGELALAFERLGAGQPPHWVASHSFDTTDNRTVGAALQNRDDRTLHLTGGAWGGGGSVSFFYRCVTSLTLERRPTTSEARRTAAQIDSPVHGGPCAALTAVRAISAWRMSRRPSRRCRRCARSTARRRGRWWTWSSGWRSGPIVDQRKCRRPSATRRWQDGGGRPRRP